MLSLYYCCDNCSGVYVNGVWRQLIVEKESSPRLVIFMSDNGNVVSACPSTPAIGCGGPVRRPAHTDCTIVGCSLVWVLRPGTIFHRTPRTLIQLGLFAVIFKDSNTFSIRCAHNIAVILLYIMVYTCS